MGGTGQQINRANWTKERLAAFRKYLGGDTDATFRGRKKNGDFYKKALKVGTLIDYYKPLTFSFRKGGVWVQGGGLLAPRVAALQRRHEQRAEGRAELAAVIMIRSGMI